MKTTLSLALLPIALVARADIYLSQDQAVQALFPGAQFDPHKVSLTSEQVTTIEKSSGESVKNREPVVLVGPKKEVIFIDQVLGKHEFITIAVGIGSDQTIHGIEILEYRETYGYQVRTPEWRKQFVGKDQSAPLKIGKDIRNISGATLSSAHITAGVRRLMQTYEVLKPTL